VPRLEQRHTDLAFCRLLVLAFERARDGVAGRTQARMDGERKTPVRSAVAAREGRSILPHHVTLGIVSG